jgi:hypothetical protein
MAFDSKQDGELFRATREIAQRFEERELKFKAERTDDDTSLVTVGFRTDHAGNVDILFLSHDDDLDVAVRAFQVITGVPEEKRAKMLEAINKCNDDYRYVRFTLDGDGDVNMEYDFPVSIPEIGEPAYEIAVRFTQVLDEAYPELMKAMWG